VKYIHHNLGLGDHIIYNGIVREYAKSGKIGLFCKKHNIPSVRFMYRDIDVEIIDSRDMENINGDYLRLEFTGTAPVGYSGAFNDIFYEMVGIDPAKKWELFHIERDLELEGLIFSKYEVEPFEYVFVHDRIKGHPSIAIEGVRPIVGLTDNIFGYCKLIEMAKEVHCVSSSFLWITEMMFPDKDGLFFHPTDRESDEINTPNLSKGWTWIGKPNYNTVRKRR